MRTIKIIAYKFDELSEDAQNKAIEYFSDINVNEEWWESTYEDAANIGLKITSSDIDRQHIDGEFTLSAIEVYQNVVNNHGEICDTFKTAEKFKLDWQPIFDSYMNEDSEEYENPELESKLLDTENYFLEQLLQDYLCLLREEYEYQTSFEAIKETLICNKYEFTESGEVI